ncbi:hypothetical protein [Maricaulis sp.]|uniref:hypothetical protein n=1 Tax=Maricaulis sp. TaxID=1486257 RepID=UPI003297C1B6
MLALPALLRLLAGPAGGAIVMLAVMWVFAVAPLGRELAAAEEKLATAERDLARTAREHLDTLGTLSAEREARATANARAAELANENAVLTRDLDLALVAAQRARREAVSTAQRSIHETDPDWSGRRIPGAVAYQLCIGLAAIAGDDHRNGVHHANCGSPPADDGRPGG